MNQFGSNQVKMRQIHDAADCLRVKDSQQIIKTFGRMEKRFPQLLFAVYLGELNQSISIAELGFWLLNQSKIERDDYSRSNEAGILLVIDVECQQAGISLGYFAEQLVSDDDCLRALTSARSNFINGDFGQGVVTTFQKLEKSLLKQARKMKGLSRNEKQALMMRNHHGPNLLNIPNPSVPLPYNHPDRQTPVKQRRNLVFRNEFESDWE